MNQLCLNKWKRIQPQMYNTVEKAFVRIAQNFPKHKKKDKFCQHENP